MSIEEQAEEYVNKKLCSLCREEKSKTKCATCSTFLTAYKCHLDGLAEGRKEQEKKDKGFCEAVCMKGGKIADLKAQITEIEKRINTLKIKNASLQKKNEQQAKQIEEMKCCGNCKIEVKDEEYPCSECDGKSKWVLAGSKKLIVYNKSNGLIADEFIYSDDIEITEHVKKFVGDTKNKDCFLLKFPSGNYCFYANSDYYYKITE